MKEITLILNLYDTKKNPMSGEFTIEYDNTDDFRIESAYLGGRDVTDRLSQNTMNTIAEAIHECLASQEDIE